MRDREPSKMRKLLLGVAGLAAMIAGPAQAGVDGITGNNFNLTAKADHISTADGGTVPMWGYAVDNGRMQYPGPTLIVNEGDTVTVTLTNTLPVPVSIVFPGQEGVAATASGPSANANCQGVLTQEVDNRVCTSVSYSFVATRPGTFMYHSGTQKDLQVDMGLVGALIVRPRGYSQSSPRAYGDPATAYQRETLMFLTDVDAELHQKVALGQFDQIDMSKRFATYWFINGRNAPDTVAEPFVPWLPTQPYNALARMHPGEKMLMRVVNAGLDLHPFHHHGNHAKIFARDGVLLESKPGAGQGADLAEVNYTTQAIPGETTDAIFEWTGKGLGWDVYGHKATDPCAPAEDCSPAGDHGKAFPVVLPSTQQLTFGIHYSGSQYLGSQAALPPGEGGFNLNGGLFFMWHSHAEKEMTNYDIFPGGMMTMLIIEPPTASIP